MTEGRKAFLARYAGIETGAECERWAGVLSAVVDGESGAEDLAALRPHLRNCSGCRATLRALRETRPALQALFPVALVVGAPGAGDATVGLFVRVYEAVVGGLQERAVAAVTKAQALVEATGAAKVTAVAASAAAVAGGGVATVEQVAERSDPRAAHAEVRRADAPPAARASVSVGRRVARVQVTPTEHEPPEVRERPEHARRRASATRRSAAAAQLRPAAASAGPASEEFAVEGVPSAPTAEPVAAPARAAAPQTSPPATTEEVSAPASSPSAPSSAPASSGGAADEFGLEG